jgi:predicted MFS family arabinose efflux permease
MAQTHERWCYAGWRVALGSSVCVFVSFASLLVYTFGVFLKPLAEEFSWSREAVSAAFGISAMTVAVVSPPLGYLLDRGRPARLIVPCMLVFGTAFASLSVLTPSLWHLYAVFLIIGIVANGTAQMAYTRAVSSWFVSRRGMALAIMLSGGALGAMVWPPIADALIGRFGWRTACAVLGGVVVIVGVPCAALFVRERPAEGQAVKTHDGVHTGTPAIEALGSRVFWILVVVLFVSSVAQNGSITHMAALLTDRGVSPRGAAIAVSAMGGASLAGRFATGWLIDRFFAPRVSVLLLSTAAVGVYLLAVAHSFAIGATASILIGLGMGAEADITPYLLSRYFGLRSFSMLYGFTWTAYAIAGAVGPVLMGRAYDLTGSYQTLLLTLAAITFAASLLMALMPKYAPPVVDSVVA